jgi:ATP-dependent exoDNAse (exonuclease V) beta subunit
MSRTDPAPLVTRHFPHVVIRASAGTGKTFQLSNRFIGLSAQEPLNTILATTFTRKAAGEILSRVLLRLADAALDPRKLAELARHVGGEQLDRARCLEVLQAMVRQLHRLRVSTLDSFFIQIARSFGLELGLPPGWEITDEITDLGLRREAVRAVLHDEATTDVVKLMHLLTKGEASRSVSEQIAALVQGLYGIYCEAPAEAWQSLARPKRLTAAELLAAVAAIEQVALPDGKRYPKARQQDLDSVARDDWAAVLGKGLGAKILDGTEEFYGKPIPAEIVSAYRPLVEHAKAVLLGRIADQTEATGKLLGRFDAAYQRLKLARRALRFEDVTRRLAAAAMAERMDEVLYRLDGQVSHLLLDEFQDTSALQWRVLRPFARRVVEEGTVRSFFAVGDVKQAIYGWRGGVAEIFEALDEELGRLPSRSLNESFRSAPVVIDCVNQVFTGIATNAVLAAKYAAAAEKWSTRFARHTTARTALPGYCRMIAAPQADEGQPQDVTTLRFAAEEVVGLHQQAPGLEIGVLVRRNQAVARLIYELRSRGIDASEEGGNPLTDSPAVQLMLSLLTLVDHPGDTTARFHVATSPLAASVALTDATDASAACRFADATRRALMSEGYGPILQRWARQLRGACDRRDVSRLGQLVELAYGYENRATTRADDFVALVRQQKVEDPTSAAVRVMTVHQAKGLQFDIVVLPELDVPISGQPPEVVAGSAKPAAPIERVCRYVAKELRGILPPQFQRMFAAHEERVVEESLCLLYVALTRAVSALHIVIAPSKANEKTLPATFAGVLRAALCGPAPLAAGAVPYAHGDAGWYEPVVGEKGETPPADHTVGQASRAARLRLPERPQQPSRGLDHRHPSGLEGGNRVDLAVQLRLEKGAALDRGTLLHAWFQQIGWLEEGEPEDGLLRKAAHELGLDALDLPELLRQFRRALQMPTISSALRRATYERPLRPGTVCAVHAAPGMVHARWELWRERPFAIRDGDTILSGKFDRVVALYDGEQAVGADVLDYKTDRLPCDDPRAVDARVDVYRPQLEAYRRAAARLLGLDAGRISARLLFVDAGIVRAV